MTIADDTFVTIREDFPDIDLEVRSILIARAQTGATISEIKEAYREITGAYFPVYNNVTDFLLCIPGVSAYCNESGTRIFRAAPSQYNKHIYDLVMNQKSNDDVASRRRTSNNRNNNNYNNSYNQKKHVDWHNKYNGKIDKRIESFLQQYDLNREKVQDNYFLQNELQPDFEEHAVPTNVEENTERQVVVALSEKSDEVATTTTTATTATATTDTNCYYEDNYNYMYNRFGSQHINNDAINSDVNNNFNNYTVANRRNQNDLMHVRRNFNNYRRLRLMPNQNPRTFSSSSPTCTRTNTSIESYSTDQDCVAHLLDFILLGDDFLLRVAGTELNCKFKKYAGVYQSGLCVSGQTIRAAIRRVKKMFDYNTNKSIIINIGSVDIMKGKPLVQIEHDFRELVNVLMRRGLTPILTTIAPIANLSHDENIKATVERFNNFIKNEGRYLSVVDIYSEFVNQKGIINFSCYQLEPRFVTGTQEPHLLWNKIGRQRVLQKIELGIEYD